MVFWHSRDASVQPLAAQLEAMSEEEKAGWQLPEKALRAFHFRAVQRIYGEQGAQVRCWCGGCCGGVVAAAVVLSGSRLG